MMPETTLSKLQSEARKRNEQRFKAEPKGTVHIQRPELRRKVVALPNYRDLLCGRSLIMPYLAVSYRTDRNDQGLFVQGSWKQFKTQPDLHAWLNRRRKQGTGQYTGSEIMTSLAAVMALYDDPGTHPALKTALNSYLKWRLELKI